MDATWWSRLEAQLGGRPRGRTLSLSITLTPPHNQVAADPQQRRGVLDHDRKRGKRAR